MKNILINVCILHDYHQINMYIDCHFKLSNESIENNLPQYLTNLNCSDWDDMTIFHFSLAAMGINSTKAKKYATELLEKYLKYKKYDVIENDDNLLGQISYNEANKFYQTILQLHKNKNNSINENIIILE